MAPAQRVLFEGFQSLKLLPSRTPGLSLADALYLDTMSRIYRNPSSHVSSLLNGLYARAAGAMQIGEICAQDLARLCDADKSALAQALRAGASWLPDLDGEMPLPVLDCADPPSWALRLVHHPRAGFESPDGIRDAGARPESQAAHAVVTALIAGMLHGQQAALVALLHNAHMSLFPDVPHRVEAALGASRLAAMERSARTAWMRSLGPTLMRGGLARAAFDAFRCDAARVAADEADFIDRALWLRLIAPRWLESCAPADLQALLCNPDHRLAGQLALLPQLLK